MHNMHNIRMHELINNNIYIIILVYHYNYNTVWMQFMIASTYTFNLQHALLL